MLIKNFQQHATAHCFCSIVKTTKVIHQGLKQFITVSVSTSLCASEHIQNMIWLFFAFLYNTYKLIVTLSGMLKITQGCNNFRQNYSNLLIKIYALQKQNLDYK